MSEDLAPEISWTEQLESYFAQTGERANGLAWMHQQAEAKFDKLKTPLDLSMIIISTINGFLSVGSTQIFQGWPFASTILGIISLFVSVLNTISSYFSYGKRCEGHRIAALSHARLYRYLSIEMSLPRNERATPHDLLKSTKDSYERLKEISPMIPPDIIQMFQAKFGKLKNVSLPEEANGLHQIIIYEPLPTLKLRIPPSSPSIVDTHSPKESHTPPREKT